MTILAIMLTRMILFTVEQKSNSEVWPINCHKFFRQDVLFPSDSANNNLENAVICLNTCANTPDLDINTFHKTRFFKSY